MGRRVITTKDASAHKTEGLHIQGGGAPQAQIDDYPTKLIKYIPAEIVATFVVVDGILRSAPQVPTAVYWIIFFVLLILTPLYIWRVTTEPNEPPAIAQILISTCSFFVWVFALGGPFSYLDWYQPVYGALVLPIFTLVIPIVVEK
jgi:hypothetical protein